MGYKLGYHILVLPNQVLHINSVLPNKVLLYITLNLAKPYVIIYTPGFCPDNLMVGVYSYHVILSGGERQGDGVVECCGATPTEMMFTSYFQSTSFSHETNSLVHYHLTPSNK